MDEFTQITTRLTIEFAKNGFLVFINDNYQTSARQIPFVFETIETLQKFIKIELEKYPTL